MTKFIAIQGIGNTADEAITDAITHAGPFEDDDGNTLTDEQAAAKFRTMPASAALIDQVETEGGMIEWDEIDGTAYTVGA